MLFVFAIQQTTEINFCVRNDRRQSTSTIWPGCHVERRLSLCCWRHNRIWIFLWCLQVSTWKMCEQTKDRATLDILRLKIWKCNVSLSIAKQRLRLLLLYEPCVMGLKCDKILWVGSALLSLILKVFRPERVTKKGVAVWGLNSFWFISPIISMGVVALILWKSTIRLIENEALSQFDDLTLVS